jgi:pSer/pThr/pTyr-binding forkhead associated (FHA) protein
VAPTSPDTIAVPVVHHGSSASHDDATRVVGYHGDLLVVTAGPLAGSRYELVRDETSVGRETDTDVLLDDVSVSRRHAVFTRTASGRVTVRDLNSLNGTYVNGSRVDEVALRTGDEVQIGKFKLAFWATTR